MVDLNSIRRTAASLKNAPQAPGTIDSLVSILNDLCEATHKLQERIDRIETSIRVLQKGRH